MNDGEPHADWEAGRLQDLLKPGLTVVFVGINPGKRSAEVGHHFAGTNNHFWQLLYDAGFTPHLLRPTEDDHALEYGVGLTNIVARPTRGSGDLGTSEFSAGGHQLQAKLRPLKPTAVCLLGKRVYRGYAQLTTGAKVAWGEQKPTQMQGVLEYVAPNPSARSTIPYAERLRLFRNLKARVDQIVS